MSDDRKELLDLIAEAMKLARDLEQGHYAMGDAIRMIRKLASELDDIARPF